MQYVGLKEIRNAIGELKLNDSIICLHSSLKSFGNLEGGPDTLITAFLEAGCTLVVPTFTYECDVPPPSGKRYLQNACDCDKVENPDRALAYDINSPMISKDMGAVPARILEHPEKIRGNHPLNSFTALGPYAGRLIAKQTPLDVYAPFTEMALFRESYVLLAGVDLTKATAIHHAEEKAGRRLFRRWARTLHDPCVEVAVGSCSEGFNNFREFVKPIEQQTVVGESHWKVYPYGEFVEIITREIQKNPAVTKCQDPGCPRCPDAVRGGPVVNG